MSIGRSNILLPPVNRVVGDRAVRVGRTFVDFLEREEEPMIEPDGVIDDLRWNRTTTEAWCVSIDHTRLSNPGQLEHSLFY